MSKNDEWQAPANGIEKESIIFFRMSYLSKRTDVLVRSCSVWLDCMPSLGPTSAVCFTKVGKESTKRVEVGDQKRKDCHTD